MPIQRKAVDAKLVISDLMVDMLKQFSNEDRGKRELETQKGSIQKVLSVALQTKGSVTFELELFIFNYIARFDSALYFKFFFFNGYMIVWKSTDVSAWKILIVGISFPS